MLDPLSIRIARRLHPEVESQAQERFQQVGMLLSRWLAADVVLVALHAAGAAADSWHRWCSFQWNSPTQIAVVVKADLTAKAQSAAVVAAAAVAAAGVKIQANSFASSR